jgi:hypothetical protein
VKRHSTQNVVSAGRILGDVVAAVVLGDSLRADEVREEVEKALEEAEG